MPTPVDTEYVEINGLPLATAAWVVNDLSPLWDAAGLRGEDRVIPFSDGALPLRRFIDEMRVQVPITVYGDFDSDGNANSDGRIGLMENIQEITNYIGIPNDSGDGTWELILHMPDGSTRVADCFVVPPFQWTPVSPIVVRGVLDIIIPQGFLISESS